MMRHALLGVLVLLGGSCSDGGGSELDSGSRDAASRDTGDVDRAPTPDGSALDRPSSGDSAAADRGAPADAPVDGPAAADAAGICRQLEADYALLLGGARECNPWTEMNECTKTIPDNLGCPCDTYVNTGKLSELKQLYALTQQWAAEGCAPCKTRLCPSLAGGTCEELPSGAGGRCVDLAP